MPLTAKLSVVATALFDKLDNPANKVILGHAATFYGDQEKIPTTPAICVEPEGKINTLKSAQRQVMVDLTVYILIYHSAIRSPQSNRRDADELAEAVEDLIHADRTLGDLLIHCMCTNIASGYSIKEGSHMRSSRITFSGQSQALLPS